MDKSLSVCNVLTRPTTNTKPVYFETNQGNYRLNFRGRVKLPSVKNFQLVPPGDIGHVWTQFGKVRESWRGWWLPGVLHIVLLVCAPEQMAPLC
jgi:hypothetical protein